MSRELMGVIHGNRFYRLPEEAAELDAARRGESTKGTTLGYSQKKPGKSAAMACHPDQVALVNAEMKRRGVRGVCWDAKGDCHITSRAGRAKAMLEYGKLVGMSNVHDHDGSYGDG